MFHGNKMSGVIEMRKKKKKRMIGWKKISKGVQKKKANNGRDFWNKK